MEDHKISALSQVPLFAACTKKELQFIASRADEIRVPTGRELTRQGQPGHSFYVLLEGEAEVEIDGRHRATLKQGDFFGEISMLDRGMGTATITTTTPAVLMVMSHSQFRDAIKASDAILVKVLAKMGERLRADLQALDAARRSR